MNRYFLMVHSFGSDSPSTLRQEQSLGIIKRTVPTLPSHMYEELHNTKNSI